MNFWRSEKRYATKEIFERQVKFYDSIKPIHTYRGIAVVVILFLAILGTALSVIIYGFSEDFIFALIDLFIEILILYFVYYGKRWAIVLMMVFLTLEQVASIALGEGPGGVIIWMAIMSLLYEALKVENARKKLKTSTFKN